jgi:hypothetical protein
MSSETVPRRTKGPPTESDISQVMAHGPALCQAYGKFWATVIMLFAIAKARRGAVGAVTALSVVVTFFYNVFWK